MGWSTCCVSKSIGRTVSRLFCENARLRCDREYRELVREIAKSIAAAKTQYVDAARKTFPQAEDRASLRIPGSYELDDVLARLERVERVDVVSDEKMLDTAHIDLMNASRALDEFHEAVSGAANRHRTEIMCEIISGRLGRMKT